VVLKKKPRPGRYRERAAPASASPAGRWESRIMSARANLAGANASGVAITPDNALTISAFWACVRVQAGDYGQIPITLVRRTDKGDVPARDHAAYSLFTRSPDGQSTPAQFQTAMTVHRLLYGNTYLEIVRYEDGRLALVLLDPRETWPDYENGRLVYRNGGETLPAEKVVHVSGPSFDGLYGYSGVRLCRQSLGLSAVLESHAAAFMRGGAKSSGVLQTSPSYTPEARKELLEDWKKMTEGDEAAGSTAVLPPDAKYQQISVNPAQSQLLESRKFAIYEACRITGTPPNRVAELDGYNYSTVEHETLVYLSTTIGPIAQTVEQMLNLKLLTDKEQRAGYAFKHDLNSFLKMDSAARTARFSAMFDRGVITGNRWALAEGEEAYEGGDKHYVQLNMSDVKGAGDGG